MAKFRDLGINSIPLTMRPPEMGAGGGGGEEGPTTQCRNTKTCVEDDNTTQCQNVRTCIYDDNTTQCGGEGATCVGEETTECDRHATCKPEYDIPTQCLLGFTCVNQDDDNDDDDDGDDDDDDNKKKKTSGRGFSPEDVAQLREQLEGRIDDSLEI